MTRKEPTGAKHARCLSHVPHAYLPSGWLCVTTNEPGRAAAMVAFADYLSAIRAAHRAAEMARPGPDGSYVGNVCTKRGCKRPPMNADGTSHLHRGGRDFPMLYGSAEDVASMARLSAELTARRTGVPTPDTYVAAVARKARKAPAPVVSAPEPVEDDGGPYAPACGLYDPERRVEMAPAAPFILTYSPADPDPLPGQRGDDGEPDAAGHAAAHDFGDVCACPDCIGDDAPDPRDVEAVAVEYAAADPDNVAETAPEPDGIEPSADLAAVKATVRAAGLVDNPRPLVRSRSRAAIRSRARRAVDRRIAAARIAPATGESYHGRLSADELARCVVCEWCGRCGTDHHDGRPDDVWCERCAPIAPAPVLAAVAPAVDGRPSCPRCGQLFRKSGNGLAWHLANRPDCAPVAPVLAAVK